ncbi:SNF2 helicase [Fadolivirus algeromassiliense]|jgi:hypothetical protein|uniref:SNF2 helicase n=1 Tax=Fadolivirus FV1/VV64 TaxID=3070911 RepID=A0A7D3QWN1_9VIRU|nr:SNF2 helicase [Fadolivirus algeromassiliense]QKF94759.1 SNF2 helicase [Fadolivirus FV1/VV64]
MVQLKQHQLLPINFMKNNKGLILFHSTGSGKTLTALYSMYQFDKDIIVLGPKSSKKAFMDNIKKANLDPNRVTFYSYKKIKNLMETQMEIFINKSVIVDEAHNLRSETTDNLMVLSALSKSYKIILLTATPVINYLNDLAVLVNLVKGSDSLPTERRLFNNMYYDEDDFKILNKDILINKLKNCISYYKHLDDENYPKSSTQEIEIEMNPDQLQEYVYYVYKILFKDKKVENPYNIDFSTLDKRKKNFFLSATRQLSNSVKGSVTPKINAIYDKIKSGPYPVIVYSNFLKNGIYPLIQLLERDNVTYKTITGDTTDDKINMIVNNYNSGKYKVLLISSAGSESLDLKNTRQIHIMEPHWNLPKITQVIGRAVRYRSHETLPKLDRNVVIYKWISIFPKTILNQSADQYLIELSKKKDLIFDNFLEIIESVSIEKNKIGGYFKQYIVYKNEYIKYKLNHKNISK